METKKDDVSQLKSLGSGKTDYPTHEEINPKLLEQIPYQFEGQYSVISHETVELTSLCPRTHQPDGAKVSIRFVPNKYLVESKSLKLYFTSYRSAGMFMETIGGNITKHLVDLLDPKELIVDLCFNPRGGITTKVSYHHIQGQGVVSDINRTMLV